MAINNSGHTTGSATMHEKRDGLAFLYRNGEIKNLGTPGGEESKAFDISEKSNVVGSIKKDEQSIRKCRDSGV